MTDVYKRFTIYNMCAVFGLMCARVCHSFWKNFITNGYELNITDRTRTTYNIYHTVIYTYTYNLVMWIYIRRLNIYMREHTIIICVRLFIGLPSLNSFDDCK